MESCLRAGCKKSPCKQSKIYCKYSRYIVVVHNFLLYCPVELPDGRHTNCSMKGFLCSAGFLKGYYSQETWGKVRERNHISLGHVCIVEIISSNNSLQESKILQIHNGLRNLTSNIVKTQVPMSKTEILLQQNPFEMKRIGREYRTIQNNRLTTTSTQQA
jgi:hypothetical protein